MAQIENLDFKKFNQFRKRDAEGNFTSGNASNNYLDTIGDEYLIGYKYDNTTPNEFKLLIRDLLSNTEPSDPSDPKVYIMDIEGPVTQDNIDTYTIVFSNNSTKTLVITNGHDGKDGKDGKDGVNGQDGADGKDGQDGAPGLNGLDGRDGTNGKDGHDGRGILNISGPVSSGLIDTYTIHYDDNTTSTFSITNGKDNTTFKGWFDDLTALSTAYPSPIVGEFAYIKGASASDPAAIYECATAGTWSDSGRTVDTSSVQTFADGQEVNDVHIVDDLTTGGVGNVLSAEQGKVIGEMIGTPITTILPASDWATKNWNTYSGTDGIFWDIRNVVNKNKKLKTIHIKNSTDGAGTIRIHYINNSFNSIAYEDHTIDVGEQTITPVTVIDYSQDLYVGFQNITTKVMLIYPTDGSGQSRKKFLSDGHIVEQTYPYALWIEVEDTSDTLPAKVDSLEKQVLGMDTIEEYIINGVKDIRLKPQEYVLSETITIPSGVKISGVLGQTVIRVPSTIKIGFQLKNVTNVTIEGITIQGAYNGTPIINNMQPVRSGIVDTVNDAKSHKDIGYQTDMTNGGVTSEYIPQIGINIYGCEKLNISNCEIKNFSYYGICNGLSGKNYRYACRFIGNYINNCYCGLHTYNEAERSQYYGNSISLCQIGVHLDSGTNMFTDNAFNANNIGMMMTNGVNHAHGFQKGNAYTHCTLFNILAIDIQNGEIFSNCKFGYVEEKEGNTYGGVHRAVAIMNSRGLFFDNCYFFNMSYFAFIGKFNKAYSSYTVGTADIFGNTPYVVTYNTLENGTGVNKISNGNYNYNHPKCIYFEGEGVIDGVYVVRKDNINITDTYSNYLNSPS